MSGIPKRLRQAVVLRQRAMFALRDACLRGVGSRVLVLSKRVADLDRYIQTREWLRDPHFDPIALGC